MKYVFHGGLTQQYLVDNCCLSENFRLINSSVKLNVIVSNEILI